MHYHATLALRYALHLQRNGSTDDDLPDPSTGNDTDSNYTSTYWSPLYFTESSHNHTSKRNTTRQNPTLMDLVIDPQTTVGLHLLFVYFFSILALYMLHKNFHRFLARRRIFALARKSSVPARTVLVTAIPEHLRDGQKLQDYFENDCGWKVESIRMVKNVGRELRQALHERELAMRGLEKAWWRYRGAKGLGHIRLPEQDEDNEENRRPVDANGIQSGAATPSRSNSKARPPPQTPDVGLALSEEPNWGEVRREHDLPSASVPPPFLADRDLEIGNGTASPNGEESDSNDVSSGMGERPSTRVPKSTLQKAIPILGEKVDAIDYWQDKFEAADAKVQALRKIHGTNSSSGRSTPGGASTPRPPPQDGAELLLEGHKEWETTEEGFVTFESIREAVSCLHGRSGPRLHGLTPLLAGIRVPGGALSGALRMPHCSCARPR